jgi:hypothetical protein
MSDKTDEPKIGAGHAAAMARLGLRELRGALYPASNVAQQSEHGLYGTATQGEIVAAKKDSVPDRSEEKESVLADHMQQAEARDVHGRGGKEQELEMELD